MTTMRSVEPLTGIDKLAVWLFPFLADTEPEPGEHGMDANGRIYQWQPGGGWIPVADREAEAG
jgi:hypothetical protein